MRGRETKQNRPRAGGASASPHQGTRSPPKQRGGPTASLAQAIRDQRSHSNVAQTHGPGPEFSTKCRGTKPPHRQDYQPSVWGATSNEKQPGPPPHTLYHPTALVTNHVHPAPVQFKQLLLHSMHAMCATQLRKPGLATARDSHPPHTHHEGKLGMVLGTVHEIPAGSWPLPKKAQSLPFEASIPLASAGPCVVVPVCAGRGVVFDWLQ